MYILTEFAYKKLMPYTAKVRGDIMIKRDYYLNRLIHNMWNGEIKVITGIRRCGKSVLLFDLFYEYLLSQGVKEEQIIRQGLFGTISRQFFRWLLCIDQAIRYSKIPIHSE